MLDYDLDKKKKGKKRLNYLAKYDYDYDLDLDVGALPLCIYDLLAFHSVHLTDGLGYLEIALMRDPIPRCETILLEHLAVRALLAGYCRAWYEDLYGSWA
jgi:hypothetical protein